MELAVTSGCMLLFIVVAAVLFRLKWRVTGRAIDRAERPGGEGVE